MTYMAPGQPIFDMQTPGGWFQAGPELKQTLVAAGLPENPVGGTSDVTSFPTPTVSLLACTAARRAWHRHGPLVIRRRTRPAAA